MAEFDIYGKMLFIKGKGKKNIKRKTRQQSMSVRASPRREVNGEVN